IFIKYLFNCVSPILIISFLIFLLFIGCETNKNEIAKLNLNENTDAHFTDRSSKVEIFLDIPKLVNKSSAEVEKTVGNPTKTSVEQLISLKKGIVREYKLENFQCEISFYEDKAVEFVCNLGQNVKFENPKEVMRSFGFNVSDDNNYLITTDRRYFWKGIFGDVDFYSIVVSKSNTSECSKILAIVKT
ncbi:MAG: hypothetical protein ABIP06_01740, partial [Pyrinomonadaceae bacterium]